MAARLDWYLSNLYGPGAWMYASAQYGGRIYAVVLPPDVWLGSKEFIWSARNGAGTARDLNGAKEMASRHIGGLKDPVPIN